jgi:hypothetical protein
VSAASTQVDRTGWRDGPWSTEADRYEFRTKAGLPGLIVRNGLGALCGYAAVPPGHPAHGHDFMSKYELDSNGNEDYEKRLPNPLDEVSVHGGITYAEARAGDICHVPGPGEPDDVWWVGFDCSHSGDESPGTRRMGGICIGEIYRDVAYVRRQVESLARQLAAMGGR